MSLVKYFGWPVEKKLTQIEKEEQNRFPVNCKFGYLSQKSAATSKSDYNIEILIYLLPKWLTR